MKPPKSTFNICSSLHSLKYWLGSLLVIFMANTAFASQVNITARFLPDANNPDSNTFENTTPNSGYCATYPSTCGNRIFSIAIPNTTGYTPLVVNQLLSLSVPYDWREIDITHANGSSQKVKIRITGVGAAYNASTNVATLTGGQSVAGHGALWREGSWVNAPNACNTGGIGGYAGSWYSFFWRFSSAAACSKTPLFNLTPGVYFNALNFMYEMQTPNPLAMSMGIYTGQITYSIGPTGDFKFGQATASDPLITLNFTLSVQHTLRVQFPAGADRLALQAEGGWQQSLYNGPKFLPKKLIANQPYQQWSSTKFKMQLQCQYSVGNDCALQNNSGSTTVPVKTMVTLPFGLVSDDNQQAVNLYPLNNSTPAIFKPSRYVNNERSMLHFEVDKAGIGQMINSGGGTFRGNVTIVWDSQI